jgi:hypothetical protein
MGQSGVARVAGCLFDPLGPLLNDFDWEQIGALGIEREADGFRCRWMMIIEEVKSLKDSLVSSCPSLPAGDDEVT